MRYESDFKGNYVKRGFCFANASLEIRGHRPNSNPREREWKKNGREVLKHKLVESAEQFYYEGSDTEKLRYLSYVMASLAGEPEKEVFIVNSKEAAAYVSWCLLRFAGWQFNAEHEERSKVRHRRDYYKIWLNEVEKCQAIKGMSQVFEILLLRHWVDTGERVDKELRGIKKHFSDSKWFKRYGASLELLST